MCSVCKWSYLKLLFPCVVVDLFCVGWRVVAAAVVVVVDRLGIYSLHIRLLLLLLYWMYVLLLWFMLLLYRMLWLRRMLLVCGILLFLQILSGGFATNCTAAAVAILGTAKRERTKHTECSTIVARAEQLEIIWTYRSRNINLSKSVRHWYSEEVSVTYRENSK